MLELPPFPLSEILNGSFGFIYEALSELLSLLLSEELSLLL